MTADYSLNDDGQIKVVNACRKGAVDGVLKQAVGKAKVVDTATGAKLKVSFFGPFYGGYHVVALDQQNYRWAMVVGPNRDYLWLLAREKQLSEDIRLQLMRQAAEMGIDIQKLIWVDQTRNDG